MNWFTPIKLKPFAKALEADQKFVCLGSCFASDFGKHLQNLGLDVQVNPFGTLFTAQAITNILQFETERIFQPLEREGLHYSYHTHSSIWANSEEALFEKLANLQLELKAAISVADWVFITLGTTRAFIEKQSQVIVANCHKQPSSYFEEFYPTFQELSFQLRQIKNILASHGKADQQVVFTVSPVRHQKEGMVESSFSKALLRSAIGELGLPYFPAYEIMMDELRDYRFYASDLLHPSQEAQAYIFENFIRLHQTEDFKSYQSNFLKWHSFLAHKPFSAQEAPYQIKLNQVIAEVSNYFPFKIPEPLSTLIHQRLQDVSSNI